MLFYIMLGLATLISVVAAISTKIENKNKNTTTSSLLGVFIGFFAAVGGVFFVIVMVISAITASSPGNKQELVSSETFTIAENTKLDTSIKDEISFISVRPDSYLEPQTFAYSYIQIDSFDAKQVTIEKVDHSHTWLFPWVFTSKTKVTLK